MFSPNDQSISYNARGSWCEALATMLPFLIYGLTNVLWRLALPDRSGNPIVPIDPLFVSVAGYLGLLIGLGIGWIKDFPRWSFGYIGLVILLTWYAGWIGMPAQALWRYGIYFSNTMNEHLEWRAWIPLGGMTMIALLMTHSLHPLRQLVTGIWNDWSRLSLVLYGFIAWVVQMYEEVHHPYLNAFILATALVVTIGAAAYACAGGTAQRVAMLVLALPGVFTIEAIFWATGGYYSPTPPYNYSTSWWLPNFLLRTTLAIGVSSIVIYSPIVIGMTHHLRRLSRVV